MNAIHLPPQAMPTVQSHALSPEQRAALATLDRVPGLTAHVRIEGPVDSAVLRRAVEHVISVHEVLGTAFGPIDGYRGLRQWTIHPRPALDWSEQRLAGDENEALAAWLTQLEAPLDLAQGRCVRVGLARLPQTRHVLALRLSALVADAGSAQVLLSQIATQYARICAQADRDQPEPGWDDSSDVFQYAQYVEWRAELAAEHEAASGIAYWQAHLSGPGGGTLAARAPAWPAPLAPATGRVQARRVLEPSLARRVSESALGAERLLHAVWLVLMARLNGFEAFLSGWRHDCRDDYAIMQGAVGCYEKLLPVVVTVDADTRVADWLSHWERVADAHVQAQEDWPVDAPLVDAPLDAVFYWRAPGKGPAHGSCAVIAPTEGPLTLEVRGGDSMELLIHADARRHAQQAVERMLDQFLTLLAQMLAQPEAPLRALDPVGPQERTALLNGSAGVPHDIGAMTVSQHIAAWGERSPQASALACGGIVLDYRTLNERANRLARAMASLGVRPGTIVALNLPRGADLIVAMLASWRAGAAYLPLEPTWPEARRQALLADARPSLMLSADMLAGDHLTPAGQASLDLRELDGAMPDHPTRLTDLAYVLYTSGSTGQPKGVAIEHGQLLNYVVASSVAMDLAASRRWALTSSVVADLGNTALFGALFNGACLVVARDEDTRDPAAFARFVQAQRIDGLKIVPSHLQALLEGPPVALPRTVILGGEAAPLGLIDRIHQASPQSVVYNHYGPTECSVGVMVHRARAQDLHRDPHPALDLDLDLDNNADGALPLTQVLPNNRVLVLDEAMRLTPTGGIGQVYLGGPQLCRGYLRPSAQTIPPGGSQTPATHRTEAFVADPFHPGEWLYRTGDLARVLPEGGVRLVGRADHQVKIRGFRVDPAEIELALLGLPQIRQAAVLPFTGPGGEVALWACVVPATGQDVDPMGVREQLRSILPAPMVPAQFQCVDDLPRLPNGKLDRAAIRLLAPSSASASTSAAADGHGPDSAPRDALETVLSQGMGLLLGREPIGIHDDFFELGGHSLLVIRLVARLRKLLGIEIEPGLVFDHPTVAELSAALRAGPWDLSGFDRLAATDWQRTETSTAAHP